MTEIREQWERLPRSARGALLITLGAIATITGDRVVESADHLPADTKQQVAFSVGVVCTSDQAKVSYTHAANAYTFHCDSPQAPLAEVSELVSLRRDHRPTLPGYTRIIDLEGSGDTIRYDFQGPNGIATISQGSEVGAARNTNKNEVGIVRLDN